MTRQRERLGRVQLGTPSTVDLPTHVCSRSLWEIRSWPHLPPLSSFQPIYALVTSLMVGSPQRLSNHHCQDLCGNTTLLFILFNFCIYFAMPWGLQDLSSLTRDWTQAPEVTVPSPDHWTAKEFPACLYLFRAYISVCLGGRWFQWPSSPRQGCQPGAHFPPEESQDFPSGLGESAVRDTLLLIAPKTKRTTIPRIPWGTLIHGSNLWMPQEVLGNVVLNSCLSGWVERIPTSTTRLALLPSQPPTPVLHMLTFLQAFPDMLGLITHAHSICKIELLAWGWRQWELLMLPLHHQLCWAPAGVEELREEIRGGPTTLTNRAAQELSLVS